MNRFFCNVLIFRSIRSQIFFKIDVLKNFLSLTGKHLCWSLFLIKLQILKPATSLKRDSDTGFVLLKLANFFHEQLFLQNISSLLLWFLQQNKVIFIVVTITLGYNQTLSYRNYYHPCLYKNIHLLSKIWSSSPNILQSFPPKSKLHHPVKD